MDGTLILGGYKLKKRVYLNLQKLTILTSHDDGYTPVIIFDLLQSYFNKKDFSDKFLNDGILVALNENNLSVQDFVVFRLEPKVSLENEIKITKKTVFGQILNQKFNKIQKAYENVLFYMQEDILNELDKELVEYGLKSKITDENIFNFSKIIEIENFYDEELISLHEHDQWLIKIMILNMINKLQLNRPKLLLCELPEYGLDKLQLEKFLQVLKCCDNIENIIVYTKCEAINNIVDDIFAYHIIKDGTVLGFDDYDEMLELLLDKFNYRMTEVEITQMLLKNIFSERAYDRYFGDIDNLFRKSVDK